MEGAQARIDLDAATLDEQGRSVLSVALHGSLRAQITYACWPGHLAIYGVTTEPPNAEGVELLAVRALLDAMHPVPDNLTHAGIACAATLRWYRTSPWGPGAVVSGVIGEHALYYDTLDTVPDAWLDAMHDGGTNMVVVGDRLTDRRVLTEHLTAAELGRRLRSAAWLDRVVTLRGLAVHEQVKPGLVVAAHHDALLDPQYTVRHFSAVQLSGIGTDRGIGPDVAAHLRLLAEPLHTLASFGPREAREGEPTWCPIIARRHARVAVLWVLGNLAITASFRPDGDVAQVMREVWIPSLVPLSDADDEAVRALVLAEVRATQPDAHGLGTPRALTASMGLRYLEHRKQVVGQICDAADDRYSWLDDAVEPLLGLLDGRGWMDPPTGVEPDLPARLPTWLATPTPTPTR